MVLVTGLAFTAAQLLLSWTLVSLVARIKHRDLAGTDQSIFNLEGYRTKHE